MIGKSDYECCNQRNLLMKLTLPPPDEKLDLSIEGEQELIRRARIAAQLAGYKSIRHFTIAAMLAIVEQFPIQAAPIHPKTKLPA